jgi:hypothetical protein
VERPEAHPSAGLFKRRGFTAAPLIPGLDALPSITRVQGERASRRFVKFFTTLCNNWG